MKLIGVRVIEHNGTHVCRNIGASTIWFGQDLNCPIVKMPPGSPEHLCVLVTLNDRPTRVYFWGDDESEFMWSAAPYLDPKSWL